jgi:lipopolysaccharide cholinephosphotransferase
MKLVPGKKLRHTYGAWCYEVERYNDELYPLTSVEFEGYEFPAPGNVDAYLRRLYGNYMQIPDVKQTHVKTIEFLERN